jgi:hypothetical protein
MVRAEAAEAQCPGEGCVMSYDEDDDRGEWDDGPFCTHWHDPSDCDEGCLCGHRCCEHNESGCKLCGCEEFEDENPLL